jgi:Protein of unknown function (DUF3617)
MKFLTRIFEAVLLGWVLPFLAASLIPVVASAQSQTLGLMPGKWDITQSMEGGPMRRDPIKTTACLNESALMQPEVSFRKAVTDASRDVPGCKFADVNRASGGISWAASCDSPRGGAPLPGTGKASYTPTAYEAIQSLNISTPFGKFDLKETLRATYLGACN